MKKYFVRKPFTIDLGGHVAVGPAFVDLDDKKAELEKHKIELFQEKPVEQKKKVEK